MRNSDTPIDETQLRANDLVAVLDIGSSAVRMVIAEIKGLGEWITIDSAVQPVSLGRDVFLTARISRETVRQILQILNGFREMMAGWQVRPENVRAIATSALREARNRDTFIDQVALRVGIDVDVIEGVEENRFTYVAVQHALKNADFRFNAVNSMIMEVGGGSTEIMLLQRGQMVAAHTLHLGTIRMEQQVRSAFGSNEHLVRFVRDNVHTACEVLDEELPLNRVRYFIAVGGNACLVADEVGEAQNGAYAVIDWPDFEQFVDRVQNLSTEEMVRQFQISYDEAESLVQSLLIYQLLFETTSARNVVVPNVSIREGLLLTMAGESGEFVAEGFNAQVRAAVLNIGRKYHFEEQHGLHVAELAVQLFDELENEHGLNRHHRLLLEVAALLHDIGTFVNPSSHHKHSQYIVANSDLFGLNRDDVNVISNVVRYHRKALPSTSHMTFMALPRNERIVVMKLTALVRVADALDRGDASRLETLRIEKTEEEVRIVGGPNLDFSVERYGLATKANLFEEVFGLKVRLV